MPEDKKKTTALTTSVGADDGQSIPKTNNIIADKDGDYNPVERDYEELLREMNRRAAPDYLHTVTMSELYRNVYIGRSPIIDGLLCSGAYILAGAPKIGKSFLVAQIAYHVSTGETLWGNPVRQGTVLYLALEDDYQRLQNRLFRMFGVNDTENLHFAVAAKQLGNGLDEQLERFVREHPDTKLIIVDTLQKVRDATGEAYSYASDYEIIGRMKQFADRHNICVLFVHHTRKQPAIDTFEMISGTTGLLGCADGAMLMYKRYRVGNTAVLEIVGRDQQDQRLYLQRDTERLIWTFESADEQFWSEPSDPIIEAVAGLLTAEQPEWSGSATELVEQLSLDLPANALTKRLNVKAGKLQNDYNIRYENKHSRSGSRISLMLLS